MAHDFECKGTGKAPDLDSVAALDHGFSEVRKRALLQVVRWSVAQRIELGNTCLSYMS